MSEKVFIISGSPRKGGNTDLMCEACAEGAREAGKEVKIMYLQSIRLNPCLGCDYCHSQRHEEVCCQKDDWKEIFEGYDWADAVIVGSPLYYYSISAQLKILFDRSYVRAAKRMFHFKKAAFLSVSQSAKPDAHDTSYACFKGWMRCIGDVTEAGTVFAGGCKDKGDVEKTGKLEECRKLGREI